MERINPANSGAVRNLYLTRSLPSPQPVVNGRPVPSGSHFIHLYPGTLANLFTRQVVWIARPVQVGSVHMIRFRGV